MAAKVLQGRFVQDTPSVEVELLESVAVCVALSLLEAVLESRPARPTDPVSHFLEDLLRASRGEIEDALVAKFDGADLSGPALLSLARMTDLWFQCANLPQRHLGDPADQLHLGRALQALCDEFQALAGSLQGSGQIPSRLLVEVSQLFEDSCALAGLRAQDFERFRKRRPADPR